MSALEEERHDEMHERYRREVEDTTGYRPIRMFEMVDIYGALEAVRRLMKRYDDYAPKGYMELYDHKRLDLSIEALIHDPQCAS